MLQEWLLQDWHCCTIRVFSICVGLPFSRRRWLRPAALLLPLVLLLPAAAPAAPATSAPAPSAAPLTAPASARPATARPAPSRPTARPAQAGAGASEEDMGLYTRIAALNVCIARSGGVEFGKAVAIAGETIAQVIQGQHGGVIQQVGTKALSMDELRKGSINSAVLGAVEVCPKEVPADVLQKAQDVLKAPTKAP
ncbi:hypothetical protein [Vulcanococcus limneticus]|uniref:hypothetical protein n=1 Tax=Vulcanococcus limneticus TaxID=2170428 RepID=UPI000D525F08|nr:hypothetical protein [Vulcanococcus limneticus]